MQPPAFGLTLLHGLITSWHPFHNKSVLKRGRVGGTFDISPSSYNSEQHATTAWSEPFSNYISEGSVSISTVLFVANPPGSIMFTLIVQSPLLRAPLSRKRDLLKIYNRMQGLFVNTVAISLSFFCFLVIASDYRFCPTTDLSL